MGSYQRNGYTIHYTLYTIYYIYYIYIYILYILYIYYTLAILPLLNGNSVNNWQLRLIKDWIRVANIRVDGIKFLLKINSRDQHFHLLFFLKHLYFKNFFLIGRIIALQCVGFCHTATCISRRYTYVPSLLNPPPTHPPPQRGCHRAPDLSSLHQRFELAASYSKFPLPIYFTCGSVYVSICPTLSFPNCVHKSVLCVCVSTAALFFK